MAKATIPHTLSTAKVGRWASIKEMFAEMDQILVQVKLDQEETARLGVEIEANFAKLDPMRSQVVAL